ATYKLRQDHHSNHRDVRAAQQRSLPDYTQPSYKPALAAQADPTSLEANLQHLPTPAASLLAE
ncbi:hypothetical protein SB766_23215, partial [Pseudomonas sp. SIMBA_077]